MNIWAFSNPKHGPSKALTTKVTAKSTKKISEGFEVCTILAPDGQERIVEKTTGSFLHGTLASIQAFLEKNGTESTKALLEASASHKAKAEKVNPEEFWKQIIA